MEAPPPEARPVSSVPVYFALEDRSHWSGIPTDRGLEWTRVFLTRRPSVPSTIIWRVRPMLEEGRPAGFSDWAVRAQLAESLGFSPAIYEALQTALDGIDPDEHESHPDNHLITAGLVPVRPFGPDLWAPWPALIEDGLSPEQATRLLLVRDSGLGR